MTQHSKGDSGNITCHGLCISPILCNTVDSGLFHCSCCNVNVAYAFTGFKNQTSHYQNVHNVGSPAMKTQLQSCCQQGRYNMRVVNDTTLLRLYAQFKNAHSLQNREPLEDFITENKTIHGLVKLLFHKKIWFLPSTLMVWVKTFSVCLVSWKQKRYNDHCFLSCVIKA